MRQSRQQLGVLILLLVFHVFFPHFAWSNSSQNSDALQESDALMKAGDLAQAEKEARLALRHPSTKPFALTILGEIRLQQKRSPEAIDFLNAALALKSNLVRARLGLGEAYNLAGKQALAEASFRKVLRVEPANGEALFALAQIENAKDRFGEALQTVEPIVGELVGSDAGILLLAQSYAGLKQKAHLIELKDDWDRLQHSSAQSSVMFSSLLMDAGLGDQALAVLEKAKSDGQVSFDLAAGLGRLYLSKSDLTRAFQSYEAALSLNPECVECLRALAKIAEQQKDPEKALAFLIKAKRKQPNNPEIAFEFGKTCLELDLIDDATSALQHAVELQPRNDSYAYVLGSANVAQKQYAKAATLFQGLLAKHPDDPVLNYAMGSLLFLEGNFDKAEKYLRHSLAVEPGQSAANYYLGVLAEQRGEKDQAITILRNVVQRDPEYGPAWEALGRVLLSERQYAEAQQALDQAVRVNPSSVNAHYQLGILLSRTGKQADANNEFETVKQLNAEEESRLGTRLRILSPH